MGGLGRQNEDLKTISMGSGAGQKPTRWFQQEHTETPTPGLKKQICPCKGKKAWLDRGLWEMEFGVLTDHKLNIGQKHEVAIKKQSRKPTNAI